MYTKIVIFLVVVNARQVNNDNSELTIVNKLLFVKMTGSFF